MARAEAIESVSEAAGGASGPLPHQHPSACYSFLHTAPTNHQQNQNHNHQEDPNLPTPPPSLPGVQSGIMGEQSDQWQRPEAADRRGPLPPGDRSLQGGGATMESGPVDTTIVAHHLRAIGDDFNTSVLRAHEAPHLQDWIEAGLNLAARTLSALYRLA